MAKYSLDNGIIYGPKFMYFAIKDDFEEVQQFIKDSQETYTLDMQTYNCSIIEVI